ncbi:hypothetical protein V6N11_034399 [Hibiscus sabdariffa]|uniref:Uncharacterized protein n=1 Tax=Hibiscus sabdariffa TaxID=183260 RepID=A0ABR2A6R5_9ROSI
MEADGDSITGSGDDISHGKVSNADNTVLEIVTELGLVDNGKASYASKVVGVQAKNNKVNPSLFGEEVVVGEEDVLVDQYGLIPSIMFSDQVLDQVDYSMRNALIVRLLGKEDCQTNLIRMTSDEKLENNGSLVDKPTELVDIQTDLFGPWMLVENRHWCVQTESRSIAVKQKGKGLVAGSRYKVLEDIGSADTDSTPTVHGVESTMELARTPTTMSVKQKIVVAHRAVSKNIAYLESNPPKKSSKKGVSTNGAVVVPSIVWLDATIVEHDPKVGRGVHKAVKIVEDRSGKLGSSHGDEIKARVAIRKSMKENVQHGLRVQKSNGTKLGDRTILAEWASNFVNQLSELPGGMGNQVDGSGHGDHSNMVYSMVNDDSIYDSQCEDMVDADMNNVDGRIMLK